jgi:hypothetical protein
VVLVSAAVWWRVAGRRTYDAARIAGEAELAQYAEGIV